MWFVSASNTSYLSGPREMIVRVYHSCLSVFTTSDRSGQTRQAIVQNAAFDNEKHPSRHLREDGSITQICIYRMRGSWTGVRFCSSLWGSAGGAAALCAGRRVGLVVCSVSFRCSIRTRMGIVFGCLSRWNAMAVSMVQSTPRTLLVVSCSSNGVPSRISAIP